MQTIKTFVENFLQAEATTSDALVKPNLDDYNQKLEIMNRFCVPELQNKFGMVHRTELWDEDFYEDWKDTPAENPRHIYKISQYQDEKYNDVYVVYLSEKNPDKTFFQYAMCLFITAINNELKIIRKYSFGDDKLIKDKFETGQGLNDISFKTLKKPIAIERYQKPENDDAAMEHYEMGI